MKKPILILFLLPLCISCTSRFNNDLPCRTIRVEGNYSTDNLTVSKNIETNFDLNQYVIFDSKNEYKTVSDFNIGDKFFIYFKDISANEIDHILVSKCEMIQIIYMLTPGPVVNDEYVTFKLASDLQRKLVIHGPNIRYAINKDHSIEKMNQGVSTSSYYGVYQKDECVFHEGVKNITLLAVYSYNIYN